MKIEIGQINSVSSGLWERRVFGWLIMLGLLLLSAAEKSPAQNPAVRPRTIEITNNQPFAVRMPVAVKADSGTSSGTWKMSNGAAVQKDGDDLIFLADLPALVSRKFTLQNGSGKTGENLILTPTGDNSGIKITFAGKDLGTLAWQLLVRDSKPEELKGEPYSTKADFSENFTPLPFKFEKSATGAVFDLWRGTTESKGLQLSVELRSFRDGFLDLRTEIKNVSAEKTENVYAAVVTRWQQPESINRAVCYDNRTTDLKEADWTNFRVGESRNWYVQRGVDWLKTNFKGDVSAAWLNEFSESFTVHQNATAKRPGRWVGANIPQVGFETQTKNSDVYILTEIARSNLKSYAERLEDNRLMPRGESVSYASRIVFDKQPQSNEQADNNFVAYTGFAKQTAGIDKNSIQYSIGVPFARFGTNYFPYSTLGENFDLLKIPGMDRDGYWPLAAETVNQWPKFADEIRRDLRIVKTMGYELVRLHHLELIYVDQIPKEKRFEYLDFLFGELRKLKLKALVDARLSAAETAELVKRYREDIDGVEVDNEVLIFGINDDAPDYWKRVYAAVKSVAPEIPVHLTAHTNTGAFARLQKLGVPFDKIGQHAYTDGLDSMPNTRGFALAAAGFGRRVNKEPIITEWNWRFLTRMTEADRAKVYAPIFENVLKTRSMPTMYQFQFNESLAMNPKVLKGIRHYEQIWLSRRPKPEAFVMADLIKKYAAPTHPNKLIDVSHEIVELDQKGTGIAQFKVTNTSSRNLTLRLSIETPADLKADLAEPKNSSIQLKPNESRTISVKLTAVLIENPAGMPLPGFYHAFLRLEGSEDLLRYGWAEARMPGEPKFDRETKSKDVIYDEKALAFSLNRPLAVVYGTNAPIQDVETAYAVVNALESAIGRPVKVCELKDLQPGERAALVLVGTAKTNQLINQSVDKIPANLSAAKQFGARLTNSSGDWLILSGADNLEAERAAMDWTLRFWKYAKDSAARKVGLIEKDLPLGVDPAQLP